MRVLGEGGCAGGEAIGKVVGCGVRGVDVVRRRERDGRCGEVRAKEREQMSGIDVLLADMVAFDRTVGCEEAQKARGESNERWPKLPRKPHRRR